MTPASKKVLMLTQYLHLGGLERMVFSLSSELKARGEWEPQAFVYDRISGASTENDLRPAFAAAGIPVTTFVKSRGFSPRLVLAIRRKLSTENITVIHTHDLGPLIYGACAKLSSFGRVRLVHTQHSFVNLSDRWIDRHYHRFFARFADEIAVVSDDTRSTYVGLGVSPKKIHVIANGVRFPEQAAVDKKRHRKDLLDALEPFVESRWILYMARLHRTKGQDHALKLWGRLSPGARGKSVLLFVGPESDAGALERLRSGIASAPDSSRILYMGATHSPERWLAAADLALSCSEFEGMPLGPIEAAGAGLPLVLSQIPGHEVVRPWSSQYPLADPAQGALLVEEILNELEAGPEEYLRRTWEKASAVRERYTLARMGADYSRLYHG